MIEINDKTNCCGCAACAQVCRHDAITMQSDKIGFLYPSVDEEKCINCHLCENVCPILHENKERIPSHVYAIKNKNINIRLNSSSGGLFSLFAENILEKEGVVYGAAFNSKWEVEHIRITTQNEIKKLQGSKYVQSKIGNIFNEVQKDLKENKNVLFSGCPCQVAGLKSFLKKEYSNLTTIDFICHGVPNPRIWKEFLVEELSKQYKVSKKNTLKSIDDYPTIESISFRDKTEGWEKFHFLIKFKLNKEFENNTILRTNSTYVWKHPYMLLFLNDYILRPSCHHCHFRNGKGNSDFTISDFWGINNISPLFNDDKGVSMLFLYNNNDDYPIWLKDRTVFFETPYDIKNIGNKAFRIDAPLNRDSKFFYILHDTFKLSIVKSLKICLTINQTRNIPSSIYMKINTLLKKLSTNNKQ